MQAAAENEAYSEMLNEQRRQFEEGQTDYYRSLREENSSIPSIGNYRNEDLPFLNTIRPLIENPENPEEAQFLQERLEAARAYSNMFGIGLDAAFMNLNELHQEWTGQKFERKTGVQAVMDSVQLSSLNREYNQIAQQAARHRQKTGKDDPDLLQALYDREQRLDQLKDHAPKPWQKDYISMGGFFQDAGQWLRTAAVFTGENAVQIGEGIIAAGIAATGVGAIAGAAGLAASTSGLLISGASRLAIAGSTYNSTWGIKYREMRNAGFSHDIAINSARSDAMIEGIIEGALGGLEAAGGRGLARAVVPQAVGRATNRWFVSGKVGVAGRHFLNWLKEGGQEFSEEFLQAVSSGNVYNAAVDEHNRQREQELRDIYSEYSEDLRGELEKEIIEKYPDIDKKELGEILNEGIEGGIGAFLSALILGGIGEGIGYRSDVRSALQLAEMAQAAPNEAVFKEMVEKAKDQGFQMPTEGMKSDEETALLTDIYKVQQERMTPEQREAKQKEAEDAAALAEVTDYRNAETTERIDEETGETITELAAPDTENIYRENNRLEVSEYTDTNEDGSINGGFVAGDPRIEDKEQTGSNQYGYINYTEKGDTVTIDDFKMLSGYENLRADLYSQFAERFAGQEIVWNPKNEQNIAIRDQLVSQNPQGPKAGLNYYEKGTQPNVSNEARQVAQRFQPYLKKSTPLETALAAELFNNFYRRRGESLSGAMHRLIGKVTNDPNREVIAAQREGAMVKGAIWFDETAEGMKRIVYLNKNAADISTVIHETSHAVAHDFTEAERRIAARALNGYELKNGTTVYFEEDGGPWTDEQHEAFAEALENYFTNGTAPNEEIKGLFERIKEFMKRIYQTMKGWTELSPQVEAFYQSLLSGELVDQARAETGNQTREQAHSEAEKGKTINDTTEAGNATAAPQNAAKAKTLGATQSHIEPHTENDIISSPDVPLEEKAEAVLDEAGDALYQAGEYDSPINRKLTPEEVKDVTEWLLNSEPVKIISDTEINLNKLEGKAFDDKIYNYFKNMGQLQVERGDWKVDITKKGIRTSRIKGIGKNKINAFAVVPEVIKNGRVVDFNSNWKGKGYDSYIIDAPIRIGTADFICEIVVNHYKNGNYSFYVHEVEEKSKLRGVSQGGMDTATPEGASKLRIAKIYNAVKWDGSSKPLFQLSDEDKKTVDAAKSVYGTTSNIKEAGYLLTDGTMLDLSGKNDGGPPGHRSLDHREMNYFEHEGKIYKPGMDGFMTMGNIRLMPEMGGIELTQIPNAAQLTALRRYIQHFYGEVIVDFANAKSLDVEHSIEYGKTNSTRIINDIKNYYEKGIVPEQKDILFQTAWSGSPHIFDRFDDLKIGTGIGTIKGHGHYVAGLRFEAENYKKGPNGRLYEVTIPDDQEYLHWDEPLTNQPEAVTKAIGTLLSWKPDGTSNFLPEYNIRRMGDGYSFGRPVSGKLKYSTMSEAQAAAKAEIMGYTGSKLYNTLADNFTPKKASMLLERLGLKGNKYKSLSVSPETGKRAHNYAIYSGKHIQIKNVLFQIIGEKGAEAMDKATEATTRLDNLSTARQMEDAGKEALAIRQATGWERGADGKWRYEIPDFDYLPNIDFQDGKINKLEEIMNATVLFAAYPELRIYTVERTRLDDANGEFTENKKHIRLNRSLDNNASARTLIHEIQHAIQYIEGFAIGGNTTTSFEITDRASAALLPMTDEQIKAFSNWKKTINFFQYQLNNYRGEGRNTQEAKKIQAEIDRANTKLKEAIGEEAFNDLWAGYQARTDMEGPDNVYRRLAGEVEARNAAGRMGIYSSFGRVNFNWGNRELLAETEDVAREDQIIIQNGIKIAQGLEEVASMAEVESNTLFQYEGRDMMEEAADFEDGKAYRKFAEKKYGLPEEIDWLWTEEQVDAWYDEFVLQAKKAVNASKQIEEVETVTKEKLTPAEQDKDFKEEISAPGELEKFVDQVRAMHNEDYDQWGAVDAEDEAYRDRQAEITQMLRKELAHPNWQSVIKGGEISETRRKQLLTMIKNSPRTYRSIYAQVMEREDLIVSAEDMDAPILKNKITDSRRQDVDSMTPEQRRKLAHTISLEEYAEKVRTGRAQFNDEMEKAYIKKLQEDIKEAEEKLKNVEEDRQEDNKYIERQAGKEFLEKWGKILEAHKYITKENEQLQKAIKTGERDAGRIAMRLRQGTANYNDMVRALEALARAHDLELDIQAALANEELKAYKKSAQTQATMQKNLIKEEYRAFRKSAKAQAILQKHLAVQAAQEKWKARLAELKEERENAKALTKAKRGMVNRTFRSISPQNVNAEQGYTIASIQRFAEPSVKKGINEFIGEIVEHDLRPVFERWKTDERLREELLKDKRKVTKRQMNKLFGKEKFEDLTDDEKKYLARRIAPVDWFEELGLDEIANRRNSNYPNINDEAAKQTAMKYLPPDVYQRIIDRPFSAWTLSEAEELARIIDDLTVQGKNIYKANIAAEKARIRAYQLAVRDTIRTVIKGGMKVDGDEAEKILGKYNEGAGGLAQTTDRRRSMKGPLFHYADMNVYRFARMLDNGRTDGKNMAALYRGAKDAHNQKLAAMNFRAGKVFEVMKEQKITERDLWQKAFEIDLGGDMGVTKFTAAEAMGFIYASQNDYSRDAIMFGNLLTEEERGEFQIDGITPEETTPIQLIAGDRFAKVAQEAQKFLTDNPSFQKLLDVIAEDFTMSGERVGEYLTRYNNNVMRKEKNYFPIIRTKAVRANSADAQLARELMGSSSGAFNLFVEKGFTKERNEIPIQYQTAIKLDIMGVWTEAMERQEHFISHGQLVKDLNAIYKKSRPVRNAVQRRYGQYAIQYIDKFINELANPNQQTIRTGMDNFVRALRGNTAAAYLGWKVSAIAKQFITSPAPFFAYMNPLEYYAAMIEYAGNHTALWNEIVELSPYMGGRSASLMIDLIKEQAKHRSDKAAVNALNDFNKLGMEGLQWIDRSCVAPGWLVLFRKEHKRLTADPANANMSEKDIRVKAAQHADDITGLTQPSSWHGDLPPLFKNNNEFAKAYLQFTQSLSMIWQNVRYDMPQMMRDKRYRQAAGTIIGYTVAGIMLGMITQWFDDDDDEEMKARKIAWWATTQFTDAFPIVGSEITRLTQQAFTGEKWYQGGNRTVLPVLAKGYGAISAAITAVQEQDTKKALKAGATAMEAAFLLGGGPVSGIKELEALAGIGDGDGGLNFYPFAVVGRRKKTRR